MIEHPQWHKWVVGVVIAASAIYGGITITQHYYSGEIEARKTHVAQYDGMMKALVKEHQVALDREAELHNALVASEKKLEALQKQLAMIQKPVVKPVPHGAEDVKADIVAHGFVFEYATSNTLNDSGARMLLEAFNRSKAYDVAMKRNDALQSTLDASNEVISKQSKLIESKDFRIRLESDRANIAEKKGDELQKQIVVMQKQESVGVVKTVIRVGTAAVIGYLAGRATR